MNTGPPYDAGAVILAGGSSRRMGTNKCLLPYQGVPLIQHVANQLQPLFPSVTVSTNTPETYEFLGLPMVCDRVSGQGPLAGIAAGIAASQHPWNFVIAADIPEIPQPLIAEMVRQMPGKQCVVPRTRAGHYEPLIAFYHRALLANMKKNLDCGNFRMHDFLDGVQAAAVLVSEGTIGNLNTPHDYTASTRTKEDKTNNNQQTTT